MADSGRPEFTIPKKINLYLRRLKTEYARAGEAILSSVLDRARVVVEVAVDYDNWNGGVYGHNVHFYLPAEELGKVPLQKQGDFTDRLKADLKQATISVDAEFISAVFLEIEDDAEDRPQANTGTTNPSASTSDSQSKHWKPDSLRAFVSHRDTHKKLAHDMASMLEGYGISSFVAHDTIEPDQEWLVEIERALKSMEVMIALLSDNFYDSPWTNQEVGYALGKGIPVVIVKIGKVDPKGFLHTRQAVKSTPEHLSAAAPQIFKVIAARLGHSDRLRTVLVTNFINSPTFSEAAHRFARMTELSGYTSSDAHRIIKAFEENGQINGCWALTTSGRLASFVSELMTVKHAIQSGKIVPITGRADEITF